MSHFLNHIGRATCGLPQQTHYKTSPLKRHEKPQNDFRKGEARGIKTVFFKKSKEINQERQIKWNLID